MLPRLFMARCHLFHHLTQLTHTRINMVLVLLRWVRLLSQWKTNVPNYVCNAIKYEKSSPILRLAKLVLAFEYSFRMLLNRSCYHKVFFIISMYHVIFREYQDNKCLKSYDTTWYILQKEFISPKYHENQIPKIH